MTNENLEGISEIPCPMTAPELADGPEPSLPSIELPRSRRRWFLFLVVALLLVATAGIAAWFITRPDPNVSLQSFGEIKRGMSISDVNGIFGMRGEMGPCGEGECRWVWKHGDSFAEVSFGQRDGKATCGCFVTPDRKQHWLPREK